ncbi:hypothetical protein HOG48_06680 [Candidatus Peregrinibacteria bacterium]|jgi:hypothetical protein|nr:hypothetical protein [Candidatus Peregrinibacteria bacterium]
MKNLYESQWLCQGSRACAESNLESRLVYFAEGAPESAPPSQDGVEAVAFNLAPSEDAKKKSAQTWSTIVGVKKDEGNYHSSGAIVTDLKKNLKELGFEIPDDMEFKDIDEVVDYVLEHTDFTLQPLRLGDIHIDQDAAKRFRDLKVEFIFDEKTQHIDFKVPPTVQFFDLDGNKVGIMDETDATHFVDVSISYLSEEGSFLVVVGKDDSTQIRRTLKYKVSKHNEPIHV